MHKNISESKIVGIKLNPIVPRLNNLYAITLTIPDKDLNTTTHVEKALSMSQLWRFDVNVPLCAL